MNVKLNRRVFLKKATIASLSLELTNSAFSSLPNTASLDDVKVGVIGLDTSHSIAFAEIINNPNDDDMKGFRVVAAFPYGTRTIESSYTRIPGYIEDFKKLGIEIVDSINSLLTIVDVVLLETNDGNLHLEQAMEVFKAGKILFIDKPIAGSLKDAISIFKAAEKHRVPVFSSSSLRWSKYTYDLRNGKLIGRILGADTYSPASIEPSHPDLFWYGVHGVETLFTVLGTGCKEVIRVHQHASDIVVGTWDDGRIGTFRGSRVGKIGYGGTAFGETGTHGIGPYEGYRPLVLEVINFFKTGIPPVSKEETIEIFAFMEAAEQSKLRGGHAVQIETVIIDAGGL